MRRAFWPRPLAALFAVWLALVMGDVGFVHPHCAMHDGPVPTAGAARDVHRAHDAPGHGALGHGDSDTPPAGHGDHACSCLGACTASSGAATIGRAPELPQAITATAETVTPAGEALTRAPDRAPFVLPFANGPPPAIA